MLDIDGFEIFQPFLEATWRYQIRLRLDFHLIIDYTFRLPDARLYDFDESKKRLQMLFHSTIIRDQFLQKYVRLT